MKKWFAELMIRVLRSFLEDALRMLMSWLLEAIRAHMEEHMRGMQDRNRAEAAKARQQRSQADAAKDHAASRKAALREARLKRDIEFAQKAAAALGKALQDVGTELPKAVDLAIDTAANGKTKLVLRTMNEKSGQRALEGHATT